MEMSLDDDGNSLLALATTSKGVEVFFSVMACLEHDLSEHEVRQNPRSLYSIHARSELLYTPRGRYPMQLWNSQPDSLTRQPSASL